MFKQIQTIDGNILLPHASEGWGRYVLNLSSTGGNPCPILSRSLVPGPFWGYPSPWFFQGFCSQVLSGGTPFTGFPEVSGPMFFSVVYPTPMFFQWSLVPGLSWEGTQSHLARTGYLSWPGLGSFPSHN